MNEEKEFEQIRNELAKLGFDTDIERMKQVGLEKVKHFLAIINQLEYVNRDVLAYHKENVLKEHEDMKAAGMTWCEICRVSLKEIPA